LNKWYNEKSTDGNKKGYCLTELLDNLKSAPKSINKPLRVCVYDFYNKPKDGISAVTGDCVSVKIESGILKEKDTLLMVP